MNSIEQSAIILLALGEQHTTEIFKYLSIKEIEIISKVLISLKFYSKKQLKETLINLNNIIKTKISLKKNNIDYLSSVLKSSVGKNKALFLMEKIFIDINNFNVDSLNIMRPKSIVNLIGLEHPQVISVIITLLNRNVAADVLSLLNENLRNDILIRIATMKNIIESNTLNTLNLILTGLYKEYVNHYNLGGVVPVAEILNYMKNFQEEKIIDFIRNFDENLADKISSLMFTFNDLQYLDNRSLRRILQEINSEDMVIALKNVSKDFLSKIFSCISNRQAKIIKEDLDLNLDVDLSQIENTRKKILNLVRYLHNSNEIFISKYGDIDA